MKTIAAFIVLVAVSASIVAAKDLVCEVFSPGYGGRECYMNNYTVIDSEDYAFPEVDETIKVLIFYGNKKIEFLPEYVSRQIPEMLRYGAFDCSLTDIQRKHFQGLIKLDHLLLDRNKIEAIRSDTFQDLVKCSQISLSGNRIKSMNGLLFQNLPRLSRVNLEGNDCIDEYIQERDPLQRLSARIDRQCGYIESTTTDISCERIAPRRYSKCCFLDNTTSIDTANSSFSGIRDDSVREINFAHNKKIFFLPIRLNDKYPELRSYDAANCSVKAVSKQNFERMVNLKYLKLSRNEIETLDSNTFEDLANVNYLNIGKNILQFEPFYRRMYFNRRKQD